MLFRSSQRTPQSQINPSSNQIFKCLQLGRYLILDLYPSTFHQYRAEQIWQFPHHSMTNFSHYPKTTCLKLLMLMLQVCNIFVSINLHISIGIGSTLDNFLQYLCTKTFVSLCSAIVQPRPRSWRHRRRLNLVRYCYSVVD